MRNGLGYYLPIPPARRIVRGFAPAAPQDSTAFALPAASHTGYAAPAEGAIQIVQLPVQNYMPAAGQEFRHASGVVIPAKGAVVVVVQFKVPQGYNGMINRLANEFVGNGFTDFQGLLTWKLFLDYQTGGGIVAPNFDNITASLGLVNNPAVLNGIFIKENQLVTLEVQNSAAGIAPNAQIIGGLIGGYFYPVDMEPPFTF